METPLLGAVALGDELGPRLARCVEAPHVFVLREGPHVLPSATSPQVERSVVLSEGCSDARGGPHRAVGWGERLSGAVWWGSPGKRYEAGAAGRGRGSKPVREILVKSAETGVRGLSSPPKMNAESLTTARL